MTKTESVSLGRCNFILDEDAYELLKLFLDNYRSDLSRSENASSADEIVEEVEIRIAELLRESLQGREVVDRVMVRDIITGMGFPLPVYHAPETDNSGTSVRKLYRDPDHKVIGGVCTGLSYYLDLDVVLVRVIFAVALILGLAGLWVYLVFWIIVPPAKTPFEKCEMHGVPATPENINKYTTA